MKRKHHNVGGTEQTIRFVVGAILIMIAAVSFSPVTMVLGVIGVYALATGAMRYCPINAMLKRNSHGDEGVEMDA